MKPTIHFGVAFLVWASLLFALPALAAAESFTLDQAIDYALSHNYLIAAQSEDEAIADGRKTEAWSAVLPHVSLEGGYTRLSEVPEINFEGPDLPSIPSIGQIPKIEVHQKMGDEDNYKAEAKIQQLLFASGQAYSAIRMAGQGQKAASLSLAAGKDDLAEKIAQTFFTTLFAQALFEARSQSLKTSEAHLADVRNQQVFGTASKFELLRSEVEVANLRPEVEQAKNAVRLSQMSLKTLMGYDLEAPIKVDGALDDLSLDLEYTEAFDTAVSERNALLGLDAAIDAQDYGTWAATSGMLPKVVAFGSWTYQKPWYFESDWTDLWSVGVGISIPVFDGLSAVGQRRQFAARSRQLEKQKSALIQGIDFSIRRALLDLEEITRRIEDTRSNVTRAETAYGMAETAYKNGVATNLEVLDAQLAVTGAKTRYIQSLYDFQIAKTQLLAASGKLRATKEN